MKKIRLLVMVTLVGSLIERTRCFSIVHYQSHNPYTGSRRPRVQFSSLRLKEKKDSSFDEIEEATIFGFPRDTVATPLAVLLVSQFLLFIGVGAVIPSIPLYGKEIGLSSAANGVVISAPAVASLLGAKFGGNFADVARKPAMLIGMAVIAASDVGTAFANSIGTLFLARLGLGAGRCISESGERGMLADLAGKAPELRGRALAAQQACVALGIAIGAPLGGIIVEEYGPRASFLCVSAAAIVTLIFYLFLPETVGSALINGSDEENDKTAAVERVLLAPAEAVDGKRGTPVSQGDWAKLLKLKPWRGLAVCQCGASFGFAAKVAIIPVLATDTLPGGAVGAGALLSAAGLSGIVGAPFGGWLVDKTGAKFTAILGGIVSAAGLLLIPFALELDDGDFSFSLLGSNMGPEAAAFSAVVIMWSLGASVQGPALTAYAQELAPPGAEATALALPRASADGTYIVAPFLLGLITDSVFSIRGLECAFAGAASLLGVLTLGLLGDDSSISNDKMIQ